MEVLPEIPMPDFAGIEIERLKAEPTEEATNKALTALAAEGKIAEFGKQAGLTYLPPREPVILGDVWMKIIQQ